MKAIVQEGYGAPERVLKLDEVDTPSIGAMRRSTAGQMSTSTKSFPSPIRWVQNSAIRFQANRDSGCS